MDNKSFDIGYRKGQTVPHDELCKRCRCGCIGGIRYSKELNIILIFMSEKPGYYNNYWGNDTLYYMGMGAGNQSLDYYGNRRLANSLKNNTKVFLIEKDSECNYKFCGEVKLSGEPFYKIISDQSGNQRKIIYFPLRPL